jgi:tetratricopeptide (TPR) repeat protein
VSFHLTSIRRSELTELGLDYEQYAVGLNLSTIPEPARFVARQDTLTEMHQLLHGHKTRSIVVLHGLGGIGKTQLVVTYTRRHKEKYTAIFWLNANDEDSLKLSFQTIADQILKHQPSTNMLASTESDSNLDQVVSAVKTWLELPENTRWLLISDNYDNPKISSNSDRFAIDIRQFFPVSDHGSIIITTRSSQVSEGQRIHVQKLANVDESLEILSNASGRKGIMNGTSLDHSVFNDTDKLDPAAIELVEELDGLPLALSTAGAYLENASTSFSDYLRFYRASWLKLLETSPQLRSYEDRSLYTTWQITLDRIEQQNPASVQLLKLWAYFDRQDLLFELLQHAKSADDEWIRKLSSDELDFNQAVSLLASFGLVDPDRTPRQFGSRGYSVHSCVHSWTNFVLNKEWDARLARLAISCVALIVPSRDDKFWWILQRRLLQHAARQKHFMMDDKVNWVEMNLALQQLGNLYSDQGKLAEAEKMYIRALQGYEEALGPKHTSTLGTVNDLGLLYKNQGKLAEAEKMYIRALQGYEEALGPKHTSTLGTVNNLGVLYYDQGKLAKAEKMYIRALQGYEEALGPKHISTLGTVNNLGLLYKNQGKLTEAEKMYIRALQGYEEALGPKHTSTLNTINNLGLLYADQGKLAEAEKMYIRALQGYEIAHGPDAVSANLPALNTMLNFGNLFSQTGRNDMAKTMYTRALSGYTAVQGPSSRRCTQIEDLLQALQVSEETVAPQQLPVEGGKLPAKSRLWRLFRKR